jgi:arsenite methyltransferase
MPNNSTITDSVKSNYAAVARSGLSSKDGGVRAVAEAFGYSGGELSSIPAEANMGLSCGNPTAFASLRPGEVVVDLGCGGGLDVFLAAAKVGPTGKVIGIDMTPEMVALAENNAAKGANGKPLTNVEFHLATIDRMPLPDSSVDCVISNCVINLAPDKEAVFREIARVLKPGGRLAASDIALKRALPEEIEKDVTAYVGCIAGAVVIDDYRHGLERAGFAHVEVADAKADLNAYSQVEGQSGCCSPAMNEPIATSACSSPKTPSDGKKGLAIVSSGCCETKTPRDSSVHGGLAELAKRHDLNDYAASVKVYAVKPR